MSNGTNVTVKGNLLHDLELKYTPQGKAVVNIRIANTPRFFNKKSNQFENKETQYFHTTLWEHHAEEAASMYQKGDTIVINGDIVLKVDEGKDGKVYPKMFLESPEVSKLTRKYPKNDGGYDGGNSGGYNNQGGGYNQGGYNNQGGNQQSQPNFGGGFPGGGNTTPGEPPF